LILVKPPRILASMVLPARFTRLVAWLALACHVLVASGVPLTLVAPAAERGAMAGRMEKDRSRPFPCMDKPCGCATAEQCFANCCCHTPAQRLAWARANRVEAAVLTALEQRVAAARAPTSNCHSAGPRGARCCATAVAAPVDPEAPEVCGEYRSLAADPEPESDTEHDDAADAAGPHIVILRDMLACGGILTAWLACGAALPPPVVTCERSAEPAGAVACRDEVSRSERSAPDAPPPRA
jgi:hypothetical protein